MQNKLAYLLFGLLIHSSSDEARHQNFEATMWLAFAASLPPVVLLLASDRFRHGWRFRSTQFSAERGVCRRRRLRPTDRARRIMGTFPCWSASRLSASSTCCTHPLAG